MRSRGKRDPEIERLWQEIEALKAELASSQKARDKRVIINLGAVAGFGAMLGGVFTDPSAWLLPLWSRLFFIIAVFACYILSATEASDASMDARINIRTMQEVETQEQFDKVTAPFWGWMKPSSLSVILFVAGTTLFSLFAFFSIRQFEI